MARRSGCLGEGDARGPNLWWSGMAGDVITRMGSHPPTHAYVELRTDDGLWAAHLRLLMALDRWAGSGRPRDGPHAVLESDRACCTGCGT